MSKVNEFRHETKTLNAKTHENPNDYSLLVPHLSQGVLEQLIDTFKGIVTRYYTLTKAQEVIHETSSTSIVQALSKAFQLNANDWTELLRNRCNEKGAKERMISVFIENNAENVAFFSAEMRNEKMRIIKIRGEIYSRFSLNSDSILQLNEALYRWLGNLILTLRKFAPIGVLAKKSCAVQAYGIPITAIISGYVITRERWRGVEFLSSRALCKIDLWRYMTDTESATLELKVIEEPSNKVLLHKCWSVYLRVLRP